MQTKRRKLFSQGLIEKKHFNKLVERTKPRWGLTSKRDEAQCGRHGWWQKAKQQWETRNPRNHLTCLFGRNNTGAGPQFTRDYSPTNWQRMRGTGVKYFRPWGCDEKQVRNPWGGVGELDQPHPATGQTDHRSIDPTTTLQHLTPNLPWYRFRLSIFGKCWTNKSHPWRSQFTSLKGSTGRLTLVFLKQSVTSSFRSKATRTCGTVVAGCPSELEQ